MRVTLRNSGPGWFAAVVIICMLCGRPARSADLDSVETLIRQGIELRKQGRDERALPLFQKAYSLSRTPRSAGQLGLCEMAVGYWVDAEKHLDESLRFPEHPWVAKNQNDLTGAVASVRRNIDDIIIEGGPPGAEVLINGQLVGRMPLSPPVRLGKGAADVEVRAPGYAPSLRSLTIGGGTTDRLTIVLVKNAVLETAQTPTALTPAPTVNAGAPQEGAPAEPSEPDAAPTDGGPRRIAAWSTAVVATLSLGFGVVETFAWVNKQHQFDDHVGVLPSSNPPRTGKNCGTDDVNYGGDGCRGLHDDLVRSRTLALVGYGLAGALGIASAILFATSPAHPSKTMTAFGCAPDLPGHGVGCRVSF